MRRTFVRVLLALGLLNSSSVAASPASPAAPPVCRDTVVDGSFELHFATNWPEWNQHSDDPTASLISSDSWVSHTPMYGAFLGGTAGGDLDPPVPNLVDTLYQTVTVPITATTLSLAYWWSISTGETTDVNAWDVMTVTLRSTAGAVRQTLHTVSNLAATEQFSQTQWARTAVMVDAAPYAGQTIRVYFVASNDQSNPTDFYFDDVSLTACNAPRVFLPMITRQP